MLRIVPALILSLVLGALAPVLARSEEAPRMTIDLDGDPAPATLDDVAWLEGRWTGTGLGGQADEVWMRTGNAFAGVFTATADDQVRFHEIMTVIEEAGSLVMILRHFGPDLVAWEDKETTMRFPLVRVDETGAHFSGLSYRREGEDALRIHVVVDRSEDAVHELEFVYRRVE